MAKLIRSTAHLAVTLAISGAAIVFQTAAGAEDMQHLTEMKISANCTTGSTSWDGRRAACDSPLQEWKAPAGHALDRESLSGGLTTKNGSEYDCRVNFLDFIEVVPGLHAPTKVTLQAHARSSGGMGNSGKRGWATCEYTLRMVALPKTEADG
ncbi:MULTISPECIES: hypothetical protein [unclassified Shinella]|uniref:hypothetical protein n=1 Tax=unclassified Shinella TaxID=2643062 RepID=UPI00225CC708|nr:MULTISPECIES: hypothetical protein [unclassified Shinella]MCO5141389.1 hypothetical protein [Shinella sp.]MDC7256408.1 hypothetical protein [Shinella sp. YE25]CAI0339271.1 conserved exported hypothetical protein [Rhizobiaceae bacterium]CAK7257682.1 Signal peptide protein [Shinella sp. WSC3-e]